MMNSARLRRLALSTSAAALVVLSSAGASHAQATLMELFFGDRQAPREQVIEQQPQAQPQRVAPPATLPRVSGPQYYTYRTDPLVRIDFSAIAIADEEEASPDRRADLVAPVNDTPVQVAQLRENDAATTMNDAAPDRSAPSARSLLDGALELPAPTAPAAVERTGSIRERAPVAEPQRLRAQSVAALQDTEILAEKEIAEAIAAHYSAAPQMIWVSDGDVNARARAVLSLLADAESHGLNPADYAVAQPGPSASEAQLTRFEMELSARALRYVRDANSGRVDPNRISGYHDFERAAIDMGGKLTALSTEQDAAAFMEGQHPQNAYYGALRAELSNLRASKESSIVIAPGTVIRPGETNAEFAKLLQLIEAEADAAFLAEHGDLLRANAGTTLYAQNLVPLVKAAQQAAGVGSDGIIGPRTILAIAGESKAVRVDKVKVAMEQLRWLPSDLGDRYVFLNAPSQDAVYYEDGEERLSMRAIYGRSATQTYFFQDEISYVEFHPYWGVPRSILVNTYLPRLYNDPSYLDRNGFEVTNSRGQRVSSSSINWAQYGANPPYGVRQLPGGGNALGELKIMFPNKHAIYMHDTPDRHLFANENRALSNGCIRLEDPRAMAAAVLGWNREQVSDRLARPHSREDLATKVPVYVAYFTAWPDKAGQVNYHPDVYDRDRRTADALAMIQALRAPAG
jgi:L,D-transpeptidase YcbB